MKKIYTRTLLGVAAVTGVMLLAQQAANAGSMTGVCSTCHTMHNSQNGTNMGLITAQDFLLTNSCVGCHTGAAGLLSGNDAPVINATNQPLDTPTGVGGTNYLAGGNFYYIVNGDDTKGHNVADLGLAADTTITGTNPPGNVGGSIGTQLTCEGDFGCHEAGAHHYNNGGERTNPALTVWVDGTGTSSGNSYRFLNTNRTPGSFTGVAGGENGDWEHTASATDHNVYWAYNQYDSSDIDHLAGFCARCHGNFHGSAAAPGGTAGSGAGSSPWIRHPTDYRLSAAGGEYTNYNTYDFIVPVAVDSDTNGATGGGTGAQFNLIVAGKDNVTCTSCHRAHASPYADMLRWSYGIMNAGTNGTTGCFKCHTTK